MLAQLPVDSIEWQRVLDHLKKRLRNQNDAEDLMHGAVVRIMSRRESTEILSPMAFMFRAARNLAIDEQRHRRIRAEIDGCATCFHWIIDDQPLQDTIVAARQRLANVWQALDELSPRTRRIFLMHRLDEMKYREIAAELGITISAVEKHIAKASHHLLHKVGEE